MNKGQVNRAFSIVLLVFAILAAAPSLMGAKAAKGDGSSWTVRSASLQAVTYGNGTFVAVGEYGTILTSIDGKEWVRQDSGTKHFFSAATYGNGTFVVLGDGGTILTSKDGRAWTVRDLGADNTPSGIATATVPS